MDNQLIKRQAREAFVGHQVSRQRDGRWLLQRPYADGRGWDWTMAAEVISLVGGGLYVGGDIDFVIFSWFSDSRDHEAKVRWMGRGTDLEYYVRQKAIIGTGRELIEVYDEDAARRALQAVLDDRLEDGEASELTDQISELLLHGDLADRDYMLRQLQETSSDFVADGGYRIGMVMAARVYYAHAALARLCDLLDARDAEEASHAC